MLDRNLDLLIIASSQLDPQSFHRIEEKMKPPDREWLPQRRLHRRQRQYFAVTDGGLSRDAARHGTRRSGVVCPLQWTRRRHGGSDGYQSMQALLRTSPRPDGVFCSNDPIAMGAMKAILEGGYRIPEDIALIGCGNVDYASLLRVPLSSVGELAAALALALVARHSSLRGV